MKNAIVIEFWWSRAHQYLFWTAWPSLEIRMIVENLMSFILFILEFFTFIYQSHSSRYLSLLMNSLHSVQWSSSVSRSFWSKIFHHSSQHYHRFLCLLLSTIPMMFTRSSLTLLLNIIDMSDRSEWFQAYPFANLRVNSTSSITNVSEWDQNALKRTY